MDDSTPVQRKNTRSPETPVISVPVRVRTPDDLPRGPPLLTESTAEPTWHPTKNGRGDSLEDEIGIPVKPADETAASGSSAPDGGYGWVIVFAVFFIHVILDGIQFSFGLLLPRIVEEFNSSKTAVGWVVSMLMGTTFFCGPLSSILSTKFGHRTVAICGALIGFAGALAGSFSKQVWHLVLSYGLLMGIGFGHIYLSAIVSVATWFDKRRGLAMGVAVCGSGVGIFAMATLIPILLEEYSLSGCFLFEAAIVLNVLIFVALLRPLPATTKKVSRAAVTDRKNSLELENLEKAKHSPSSPTAPAVAVPKRGCCASLLEKLPVFGLWEYWVMLVVVMICGFSGYIPFSYLPARAEREADVTQEQTKNLVIICGAANLVGRLLSGVLAVQPWCNRYVLYCSAFLISGVTTAFSIYCTTFAGFAVYGAIYGFTGGVIIALQSVVLSDIVGIERFSGAFGISLFVLGFAALLGTPAAGKIVDMNNGDYHLAFIIFGIIMAVGGAVFLPIPIFRMIQTCRNRRSSSDAAVTAVR